MTASFVNSAPPRRSVLQSVPGSPLPGASLIPTSESAPGAPGNHLNDGTDGRVAHWFAVRVRSRHDAVCRAALETGGFESWAPLWRETVRWTDRTKVTERPLFPGYVFARFATEAASRILAAHPGICEILSLPLPDGSMKPVPIPDIVIASLRIAVAQRVTTGTCPYVAGSVVTVKSGPWAGFSGVVTRIKGATTLYIPVEVFERSVAVPIDVKDVQGA